MNSKTGHTPALDGLRGAAISLVLLDHFVRLDGAGWIERTLRRLSNTGWLGVDLFFVLSGFLITGILLRAKEQDGAFFGPFYARRTLRIFPLYFGYLALMFWALPQFGVLQEAETSKLTAGQAWYWSYLGNFWMIRQETWTGTAGPLRHFWSLAIEEQFYLLWPLLIWALPIRRIQGLCLGALGVSFALRLWLHAQGAPGFVAYVMLPSHWDGLALGAWLAVAMREPPQRERIQRWARPTALVSALGLAVLLGTAHGNLMDAPWLRSIGYPLYALSGAAVLACAIIHPRDRRIWSFAPLRYLGRRSYALYVLHPLLLTAVLQLGYDVPALSERFGSALLGQAAFAALLLPPLFGICELSWRLYESPILRLKSRFPMEVRAVPEKALSAY